MKRNWRSNFGGCALFAFALLAGCASGGDLPRRIGESLDGIARNSASGQFLYVDPGTPGLPQPLLYPVRRTLLGWELAFPPVAVNLGRSGVAPPFEKREGDGRTPSGMFPLRTAFGYPAAVAGTFPYRQVDSHDLWVDDPQSPDYNRWVSRGETRATSFEELLRPDPLYKYALALDYNSEPVVRDLGSAIFIHVERGPDTGTAGCVSLPEKELVQLIGWLDPEKRPQVVIGGASAVAAASAGVAGQLPDDLPSVLKGRLSGGERLLALRHGTGGFFAAAVSLPPEVGGLMQAKKSWRPECPVPLDQLAYLVTSFWGFDGKPHYGELVVHRALAAFFMDSLHHAYNGRFPIERMELIDAFDADDFRSMEANNSSAFNCREVPGRPGVFSRHSYGAAIDVNPRQNPYLMLEEGGRQQGAGITGAAAAREFCLGNPSLCRVLPAASFDHLDRQEQRPGMLLPGDPLLTPFRQRGFTWGGSWRFPDYQHLEYDLGKLLPGV
ncbi:M15 family metallopeptidase [Geomonas subterranea]|uniref:M15 family metallopeptidase n=1 Tax=Geomonas subterranea TaxID=2847989 RepID=A0ABX8LNU8_9BACT|nr:M15 family metallopeptidase [Geomonas subterranea]QXE91200.1 M15 family metallopeptidase [Geomonas subterranea]QXM10714.1 M15 family metallopeptidase [Geomonas subterranea]